MARESRIDWQRLAASLVAALGLALLLVAGLLWRYPLFFSDLSEVLLASTLLGLPTALLVWLVRPLSSRLAGDGTTVRAGLGIAGLALLAVFVLFGIRSSDRSWVASPRVLLFCVDGADAEILESLGADGQLPNLTRLSQQGVSGLLESYDPSYSPVVWTSIASGVSPEVHGIQSFYSTQSQLRVKRVWEILQEQGMSVGIFRWWAVWPPAETDGFLIPGVMARDDRTWPTEYGFLNRLRGDQKAGGRLSLRQSLGYLASYLDAGLRFKTAVSVAIEVARASRSGDPVLTHVAKRRAELRMSADVYGHLLRRFEPGFASFYDNGIDVLQHDYWKYLEPEGFSDVTREEVARYGDVIPSHYRLVDEVLGDLLEHVGPSTYLVVLSDHGFRSSLAGRGWRLIASVQAILEDLGLQTEYRGISVGNRTFAESRATGVAERDEAAQRVIEILGALRIEETGERVFDLSVASNGGVSVEVVPDGLTESQHVSIDDRSIPLRNWVSERPGRSGDHDLFGIFKVIGPGVEVGSEVQPVQMVDIAPTLLYLLRRPVSREMEGRVLTEILAPGREADREIRWVDSYGEYLPPATGEPIDDEKADEVLRSLGYIQ